VRGRNEQPTAAKNAYKWQTLTKEENELLKNLGSFSLTAYRQRLYLFGGKKGATEGSNDLYWYPPSLFCYNCIDLFISLNTLYLLIYFYLSLF
jgi:hypothetical protein